MKPYLNETIVSSYNSQVTFFVSALAVWKQMMGMIIGWVVMVDVAVTIHSAMI